MVSVSSPGFGKDGTPTAVWGDSADSVLNEIATRARTFTNADGAAIAVRDGDALVTRASVGVNAPDVGVRIRIEGSFTGLCLEKGTALHCEDSDTDPRVDAEVCRALCTRSFIVVPVAGRTDFISVLAVFSQSPRAFTRTDVAVLKTMAEQVAAALAGWSRVRSAKNPAPRRPEERQEPLLPEDTKPVSSDRSSQAPDNTAAGAAQVATAMAQDPPAAPAVEQNASSPEPVVPAAEARAAASELVKEKSAPVSERGATMPQAGADRVEQSPVPQPSPKPKYSAPVNVGTDAPSSRQPAQARVLPFPSPEADGQLVSLAEAIQPAKIKERSILSEPTLTEDETPVEDPLPALRANAFLLETEERPRLFQFKWLAVGALGMILIVGGSWAARRFVPGRAKPSTEPAGPAMPAPMPVSPTPPADASTALPVSSVSTATETAAVAPVAQPTAKTSSAEPRNLQPVRPDPSLADLKPPASAPVRIVASAPKQATAEAETVAAPELTFAGAKPILPSAKPATPEGPRPQPPVASQLEPSVLIHKVAPKYPATLRDVRTADKVVLHLTVLKNGTVGNVQIVRGQPMFAAPAVAAVRQWIYKPARANGTPVESTVDVIVNFDAKVNR